MKTNRLPCLLPAAIELLEARIAPATFLVTNLGDSGSGSLRDAVARANATPAQDIVLFEPSLAGTVLLQTGEILVTEPLTLKGPSSRSVTLDGNQNSRILNISSAFVTISNLGFENGRATLENGGAILSDEALSIENCRFEGNTASEGGAVYVSTFSSKKLTIKSTLVDGNVADSGAGGGLFLDTFGPINLIDSTIRGNTATQGAGGVYLHTFESAVRITDCTVTENVAGFNGGGMLLLAIDSKTFIKGSVFTKNVIAAGSNGGGGGLYSLGGDLDLKNVILAENTADHGGGASIFADKARIVSTSVSRNTSIAPGAPRG